MTDQNENVLYEVQDRVAIITLNRPDRLNALLPGMDKRYTDLLRKADADPNVRAVVVTGAGRGFCSGADLSVLSAGSAALDAFVEAAPPSEALASTVLEIGTPVVTAINGPSAGLGFVIAISADARFSSHSATFSTTFVRLGLIAEYGSAWLLTRLVGLANATDLLLTGRTLTADDALAIGLVNDVVEDPVARALEWARDVADNCSPTSTAVIKSQLLQVDSQNLSEAVDLASIEMRKSFARPDLIEAMTARMENRQVEFGPR